MFNTLLKAGSQGPEVQYLQSLLNRIGFNSGTVDGIFGPRTENAVKRFQRAAGLDDDGIVGPLTRAALEPYALGVAEHVIRAGETFYLLARRYGTTVESIETANPGVDPLNLQVGQRILIPFMKSSVPTDVSYGYPLLELNIRSLKLRFPFLEFGSIGKSVLKNDLYYIRFGKGRKEVFYNAAHHANEWLNVPVMMKYIEDLSNAYISGSSVGGADAEDLYNETSVYFVPMVNPDGVSLVTGWYAKGSQPYESALKLNVPGVPFPAGWKANIAGTDLNLNYPAGWEEAKAIKYALGYTSPRPFGYVGEYPFSAPETKAMGDFTKKHEFRLTLSYHSQGEIIYWQFLNYRPRGALSIANAFAEVSGYSVEDTPEASAYAGYKDWFIQEYLRPGYTIETGKGTNPLPVSQIPEIYRDNIGIMTLGAVLAPM